MCSPAGPAQVLCPWQALSGSRPSSPTSSKVASELCSQPLQSSMNLYRYMYICVYAYA
jgi:hypothetical protein